MFTVYVLKDSDGKIYKGLANNIERRLNEHNSETQIYTKRYAPWALETYISFSEIKRAIMFEKYLKSGSGKAFIKNHL